jgi:hypothetical protein
MPGEGGSTLCGVGVRHCRNGVWGTCEITGTYELEPSLAALVTVPRSCGICDPDCAYACDYPSAADLPGRGVGVVFDPAESGLVLPAGPGGGPGMLADTDGDGVPDAGDECPGAGFRAPCTPGTADDGLVHTLAFGGPSAMDPLNLTVTVRTADVYFLMDTTGSMGGEISNLRAGITTGTYVPGCPGGIMGAIRCIIPDAWFGVGHHDDFPYAPFGSAASGDVVYRNLQDITMSTATAALVVMALWELWAWAPPLMVLTYDRDGRWVQQQQVVIFIFQYVHLSASHFLDEAFLPKRLVYGTHIASDNRTMIK